MLMRRVAIQNVRSFLRRQEMRFDGGICIIVGPNGGGKTNLLDAIVVILRRHLITSIQMQETVGADQKKSFQVSAHHGAHSMILEKNWAGSDLPQILEIDLEVSQSDITNMTDMKNNLGDLISTNWIFSGYDKFDTSSWNLESLSPGTLVSYTIEDGIVHSHSPESYTFLQYMRMFELHSWIQETSNSSNIKFPILNLPTTRAANFQANVQLSQFNQWETKSNTNANYSRTGTSVTSLAIGRLAMQYRLLLEKDDGQARKTLNENDKFVKMTNLINNLGYGWLLQSSNPMTNSYDLFLEKSGMRFHLSAGSSGEKEIVTYILAVYALEIRDALIIVDEPELHLHPRWQRTLLNLFEHLSETTGNQFLLATHSAHFISPISIQYVSRVHSEEGGSRITPIDLKELPDSRKMLNLINSQNNEKIFFADRVLLVEGITDRIFMEAVISRLRGNHPAGKILEVINVDGKALFSQYAQLLAAGKVESFIMADFDYLDLLGGSQFVATYKPDAKKIKKDIINNSRSVDGDSLVDAIDNALISGNWNHAKHVWDYIKSRRRRRIESVEAQDSELLSNFRQLYERKNTYILSHGSLESYLPPHCRSKNVEVLVDFLARDSFWDELKPYNRDEIERIALKVIDFS